LACGTIISAGTVAVVLQPALAVTVGAIYLTGYQTVGAVDIAAVAVTCTIAIGTVAFVVVLKICFVVKCCHAGRCWPLIGT